MFHAGKATLREPDMVMTDGKLSAQTSEKQAECSTGDFPIDINDDGTIDTPEGELEKKAS